MMISRRTSLGASFATGLAAGLGLPLVAEPPSDVLTAEHIRRAAEMLRRNSIPAAGGHYRIVLHPVQAEQVELDSLTANATYRVRRTAWSLYEHECRRQEMGKRGHVTAAEVFARVAEGPVKRVPPPVKIETYACPS